MNPLLIIAVAAGAFYVGQRMKADAPVHIPFPEPDAEGPGPEGSGSGEVPTSEEGAENLAKWDALEFDVDVFPAGSPLQTMSPPLSDTRWAVAPDCEAIAIGHGFWQRLRDSAQPRLDGGMGVEETIAEVTQELFSLAGPGGFGPPSMILKCITDGTTAGNLVLAEIRDRVRFMSGGFLTASPQVSMPAFPMDQDAGGTWTPVKNRSLPRMTDAVMHALGRKR